MTVIAFCYFRILWCVLLQCFVFVVKSKVLKMFKCKQKMRLLSTYFGFLSEGPSWRSVVTKFSQRSLFARFKLALPLKLWGRFWWLFQAMSCFLAENKCSGNYFLVLKIFHQKICKKITSKKISPVPRISAKKHWTQERIQEILFSTPNF